jgi:hypothetical protein
MDAHRFDALARRRTAGLTRRALVAAPAFAAVAPAAGARRKRKRKKTREPPPLASAVAILTDIAVFTSDSERMFSCHVEWVMIYPAGPASLGAVFTMNVAAATTGQQKRAALASEVRNRVVQALEARGFDVPADRVDVALI